MGIESKSMPQPSAEQIREANERAREDVSKRIQKLEQDISDYQRTKETYRTATPDSTGNIRNPSGDAIVPGEGIRAMDKLIAEEQAEKAKEESKLSQL